MPAAIRDPAGKDLSIDDVAFTWKSVESAGEKEGKDVLVLDGEEVNGKGHNGWGHHQNGKSHHHGGGKTVLRKEDKGLTGLKGLMRSKTKTKTFTNGYVGDGSGDSSPRTSGDSFIFAGR